MHEWSLILLTAVVALAAPGYSNLDTIRLKATRSYLTWWQFQTLGTFWVEAALFLFSFVLASPLPLLFLRAAQHVPASCVHGLSPF